MSVVKGEIEGDGAGDEIVGGADGVGLYLWSGDEGEG